MLATSTFVGEGFHAPEWAAVYRPTSLPGAPPLIWCHGNNQTARSDYAGYFHQLRMLAQGFTVLGGDFAGSSFGNDLGIERVQDGIDWLATEWGASGPVVLAGASMGAALALNYAVRNPDAVRAVACVIPALDLRVAPTHPAADEIDTAFPPAYDDNNPDHRAHNPIHFASDLPADMPVHLFTSSNDTVVPPETADAFVAARPQTKRTVFGAYGHAGIGVAMPLVVNWLNSL